MTQICLAKWMQFSRSWINNNSQAQYKTCCNWRLHPDYLQKLCSATELLVHSTMAKINKSFHAVTVPENRSSKSNFIPDSKFSQQLKIHYILNTKWQYKGNLIYSSVILGGWVGQLLKLFWQVSANLTYLSSHSLIMDIHSNIFLNAENYKASNCK